MPLRPIVRENECEERSALPSRRGLRQVVVHGGIVVRCWRRRDGTAEGDVRYDAPWGRAVVCSRGMRRLGQQLDSTNREHRAVCRHQPKREVRVEIQEIAPVFAYDIAAALDIASG